jgi:hypothetical protein
VYGVVWANKSRHSLAGMARSLALESEKLRCQESVLKHLRGARKIVIFLDHFFEKPSRMFEPCIGPLARRDSRRVGCAD